MVGLSLPVATPRSDELTAPTLGRTQTSKAVQTPDPASGCTER
jgi:hypothetical protein